MKDLVELSRSILRNEKHWTQVDVSDRADAAALLAEMVLDYLQIEVSSCSALCQNCKLQREALS